MASALKQNVEMYGSLFYPRDALHSAVSVVVRCLSVCLSHAGIVSKLLILILLLILSSATLEPALICLTAVINCTNSHLSTDVSFATAIDMFCSVGYICYLI